ncbi:MAG: hypothetical protein WD267_01810 [Balneolales bacterium]
MKNYFRLLGTFVFIISIFTLAFTKEVKSQPHDSDLGVGVVLGEPSGITAKLWLNQRDALSGLAAWSLRGNTTIHLHADYIRHNFEAIQVSQGSMAFFYGLGGRILTGGTERVGIRVPFGLTYFFSNDPLEIFVEIAPILDLAPATEFTGNSGLGIRYYF